MSAEVERIMGGGTERDCPKGTFPGGARWGFETAKLDECSQAVLQRSKVVTLSTILLIILILVLVGALPTWGYSRSWGYGPSGIVGVILLILLVLLLMGRI